MQRAVTDKEEEHGDDEARPPLGGGDACLEPARPYEQDEAGAQVSDAGGRERRNRLDGEADCQIMSIPRRCRWPRRPAADGRSAAWHLPVNEHETRRATGNRIDPQDLRCLHLPVNSVRIHCIALFFQRSHGR